MRESFLDLLRESTSFFSTLQEENRQEIVSLLFENGGMSVTEITDKMDLSRPAISHHLKLLLQTDLVYVEKRGKERVYFLNVECVKSNVERFMNLLNQF
ncbi:ArsR/SmtB family transcription factor [Enterococcus casseliflavus]|uniref:ArsR/SmtB family transcription factor n=1 Tax=Enterococcus casseliflavus TaxID=37734 RepID=UPI0011A563E9|nr:metalloregulator ArsR/SmtB family transcription factor [Enterococcus casseliflavus]